MRVLVEGRRRIGHLDHGEQFDRAGLRVARGHREVGAQRLDDLKADRVHRVQRGHRLLEDRSDVFSAHVAQLGARQPGELTTIQPDAPIDAPIGGREPQQSHRTRTLTRPGLSHDRKNLAGANLVVQIDCGGIPGPVDPEIDSEILDLEDRFCGGCGRRWGSCLGHVVLTVLLPFFE